ncbi:MipA/OmpV family protein [uncultured Shewanella sp.]|uniref:MipA/OmpV family protein n=1 Tax=uncultured Shewanella sp. TaxID=173975 RepID=UPI00263505BA|nr:MipA/OmpV family protein [uncultured Shewanella sp.]
MTLKMLSTLSLSLVLLAPFSALQAADNSELASKMPPPPVQLGEDPSQEQQQETSIQWSDNWGIGIGMRRGDIPYATEEDEVYDTLPLIYFENDYFYINGMEAAAHLWKNDNHQINLYTRFRFVDIPKELQNESQSQAFDFGLQYRFVKDQWDFDLAFLSDSNKRSYGYSRTQYTWESADWKVKPYAEFQWKSADFNNYYYGLEQYEIGGGVDFNAGVKARYHVFSNLYLLGQFGVGRLEDDVYDLPTINNRFQYESFLGFGFFPEPNSKKYSAQPAPSKRKEGSEFIRIAHGWATPSNLNAILKWQTKTDPYNNQMTSAFYGTQLTDSLFNFPIDLYLTPGLVWHHSSEVQDNLAEAVIAVKAFYTFEIGPRFRLGVGEGLSYVSNVTHIEGSELAEKDYKPSKLLNYLDFSLDVNVGDVFNSAKFDKMWFGYSIHHRSGIFESSSAFGRISGGSNYQTIYLQWHF